MIPFLSDILNGRSLDQFARELFLQMAFGPIQGFFSVLRQMLNLVLGTAS